MTVTGVVCTEDEGNDKTYEHEAVTAYWLEHYCTVLRCDLCGNKGVLIRTDGTATYCICPNGQTMRRWEVKL